MPGGEAAARAGEHAAEGIIAKAAKSSLRDAESVAERTAMSATSDVTRDVTKDLSPELRDAIGKTFDEAHPGPLSEDLAKTFKGGRYTVGVTDQARGFYRAGDAGATRGAPHLGQFWTDAPPESVTTVRRDLAVKEEWTDAAGNVTGRSPLNTGYKVEFPPGTVYYYGEVASQGGKYVGGGMQYVIREPWTIRPQPPKISEWPLKP